MAKFTITAAERERLCWVAKASSTDKTRPHLTGVLLDGTGEKWKAVATDSYRLHETTFDAPGTGAVGWISNDHAKALAKIKSPNDSAIEVADFGTAIEGQISPAKPDQYPDCTQLWPDTYEYEVAVDLPAFTIKATARAKNLPAKLRVNADADTADFILTRAFEEGDIGVNPGFFCDAVAGREGTRVRTISPLRPMLFVREHERALVMPVQLNR